MIEEYTVAAAHACLTVPEQVAGKADARPEVQPIFVISSIRKSIITWIENAAWRIEINARLLAGAKACQVAVHIRIREIWIQAQSEVERKFLIDAQVALNKQVRIVGARAFVFSYPLHEGAALAEEEISQRIVGKGPAACPSELAVGAEVVHDVALAIAVITTEREFVPPKRQPRSIGHLIFVAQEGIGVARVDLEVSAYRQMILRGLVVVVIRTERGEAGRIVLQIIVVRPVESENHVVDKAW